MGNHKHGISGKSGPSPKTKFMTCFDANRLAEARVKPQCRMWPSIQDLMKAYRVTARAT